MDNYKSILHDLVHSKRSSLESSDSFPRLKPNSLFCNECSKNMLSYIAVIQDVLDVVVGDIAEKQSGKSEECLHLKASPDSADVQAPKKSGSSRKKRQSLNSVPMSAAAGGYTPTRIPTFAESSSRDVASSQTTPSTPFAVQACETFMTPKEQPTVDSESRDLRADSNDSRNYRPTSLPIIQQLENLKLQSSMDAHNEKIETNVPLQDDNVNFLSAKEVSSMDGAEQKRNGIQNEDSLLQENYFGSTPTEFHQQNVQDNHFRSIAGGFNQQIVQDNHFKSVAGGFHQPNVHENVSGIFQGIGNNERASDAAICETTPRQSSDDYASQPKEQSQSPVLDVESEQAYVTLATSNLRALSCLVLGYSLLAARTTRSLVVLVSDGVCSSLRYHLSTVFTIVQSIESLGTRETTTISLLEDPEMGISFVKLHVWQLKTFRKCVYLDPDTLVLQNCDELFKREELSAVPDIGWPDCFNSGVFVYAPSLDTFWDLIDFLDNQDSYDGGDQGLLNMYFKNWVSDISRKLPFLYNMMANVSYTYKPALKQFGKDVKIVHFFGSYKPWSVPFHSVSGDLLPTANVHPTYVQFVKFWLDIFVSCVLPLFDEDVVNYCHSQVYITVQDLLQFFHSPIAPETLPVQPSFRLYPESMHEDSSGCTTPDLTELDINEPEDAKTDPESTLPGSELGDYRGMEAWEQGRADYLGQDKSDKIMARLDFLMQGNSKNMEK